MTMAVTEGADVFAAAGFADISGAMAATEAADGIALDAYATPLIWGYRPLDNSTETLGWRTDVLQSAAGEMRVSLRDARQAITFNFTVRDDTIAEMEWLVREFPQGDFHVPIWWEASRITTTPGQTVFSVAAGDYRVGSYCLFWKDCDSVQVRRIQAVGTGTVTVSHALDTVVDGLIMPARIAFMDAGLRYLRIWGKGVSQAEVTFNVRDNADLGATPFVQYLGLDLVRKCGVVEPLAASVSRETAQVDSALGLVVLERQRDFTTSRHTMSWRMDLAKLWERRKWLHYLRGRDRAFWLADWQRDFTLLAPITSAGTTITVSKITPVAASLVGRHILIDDGTATAREITAATTVGNTHVLTIAVLGRNAATAKLSLLRKVRLDSDVIEIAHRHGFVAEARLPLVEVLQ